MVRPICHDPLLLAQPSVKAQGTPEDLTVADDLLDTLQAHSAECVGMAANMIGVNKRIIAVNTGFLFLVLFNPEIAKGTESYETEEGCLSLAGVRKTRRYQTITVRYQDRNFVSRTRTFTGFAAQIIQHEIDHCNGVLI
jgi:peptide deformylase